MLGLMSERPLLISSILTHAAALSRRCRDRLAHSRRSDPPLLLSGGRTPCETARECFAPARHWARRPGRDLGLEHVSPFRIVLRDFRYRSRLSHDQSAPVRRPNCLYRQPCCRPAFVCRCYLSAIVERLAPRFPADCQIVLLCNDGASPETSLPTLPCYEDPACRRRRCF